MALSNKLTGVTVVSDSPFIYCGATLKTGGMPLLEAATVAVGTAVTAGAAVANDVGVAVTAANVPASVVTVASDSAPAGKPSGVALAVAVGATLFINDVFPATVVAMSSYVDATTSPDAFKISTLSNDNESPPTFTISSNIPALLPAEFAVALVVANVVSPPGGNARLSVPGIIPSLGTVPPVFVFPTILCIPLPISSLPLLKTYTVPAETAPLAVPCTKASS